MIIDKFKDMVDFTLRSWIDFTRDLFFENIKEKIENLFDEVAELEWEIYDNVNNLRQIERNIKDLEAELSDLESIVDFHTKEMYDKKQVDEKIDKINTRITNLARKGDIIK